MEKSSVSISVSSVCRVLLSCKNIKRLKLKKFTLCKRKNALEKEMEKGAIFRRKIFNLDGPDAFQYYFYDTRKETTSAIRRQMGRGSAMVWAGIGYFGKTTIKFIVGRMNSVRYINLIKEQVSNHAERTSGLDYIF